MFGLKFWLNLATNPQEYIWIKTQLIKESPKAILIEFDGKQIWLPKGWIVNIKRNKGNSSLGIKISLYHWAKRTR